MADSWQDLISAEAKKQGLDPRLALAVASVESSFDPGAVSSAGARGLMQLMPATARALGVNIDDPADNIRGGVTLLKQLLDQHGGDVVMALRRYNASPRASEAVTDPYVKSVLGRITPSAPAQVGTPPPGPAATDLTPVPSHGPSARPLPKPSPRTPPEDRWTVETQPVSRAAQPPIPPLPGVITRRGRYIAQPPAQATPPAEILPEEAAGRPPGLPTLPGLQTYQKGVPAPPELSTLETVGAYGAAGTSAVAEQFDPRERTGRRNLAGLAGSVGLIAAAPLTGGASLTGLGALGAGVTGAATAGTLEELGEQYFGSQPPSTAAALGAGVEQGAYELAGQGIGWGTKAFGRRLIASRVGKLVHEKLRGFSEARIDQLRAVLDAAKETARDVREAGSKALALIKGTEPADYTALVAQAPADVAARAGRAAQRVIGGASSEYRTLVGQQLRKSAEEGPPVDITALKKEAQAILDKQVKPPETAFPRKLAEEGAEGGIEEAVRMGNDIFPMGEGTRKALEQKAATGDTAAAAILAALEKTGTEALEDAQSIAQREMLKHPAMGVINRILNADDVVPFLSAHLWKSELQDALRVGGAYDRAITRQVTRITQRLADGLRDTLRIHEPYNLLTEKYKAVVTAHTKHYAAQFRKLAETDPDALVRMIKTSQPGPTRLLRDLLVGQSAEVGKGAEGQAAWDLVRTAWTQQNVLKGGIEKLGANLAKLPRSFTDVFYGDASGSAVFQRLHTINSAYQAAVTTARAGARAGSRQAGRDVTGAARALQRGRRPTPTEREFLESSIAGKQLSPSELAAHGIRAVGLGPFQIWGGLSWLKLLTGPQERDLLHWGYLTDAGTEWWIKALTGRNVSGEFLANGFRAAGILNEESPASPVGQPSPIGQPPPR